MSETKKPEAAPVKTDSGIIKKKPYTVRTSVPVGPKGSRVYTLDPNMVTGGTTVLCSSIDWHPLGVTVRTPDGETHLIVAIDYVKLTE